MHVLYSFPDVIGRPGIGTTAFHQVDAVARRGVDVTLYCTSSCRELPDNVRVVRTLAVAGRRIPHKALGVERAYSYHDLRVASAIRRLGASIDVVHCWPRATVHTCRAARAARIPCLREVPNTHTGHAFEVVAREAATLGLTPAAGHSHTFSRRTLSLEQQEYALADALLVPSEYARRTFSERGVPDHKLVLHRYGCDTGRFFAPEPGGGRTFTAIFVGQCEPRKGLHHALRAWLDSGAAETGRFAVCGSFDRAYGDALAPLLAHPSVELRGFVDDPSALMRESDVLLFPSVEEGSALVTYEARASGCVLVVSSAAGALCRHGVDALVHEPGDVAALTEHLRRLLVEPDLLRRLRQASLARADELSWTAAGEELVGIYSTFADAPRSARVAVAR